MAILTAIVGAIVGALATYLIRRRFEKSTATIQQFQYYHSEKMVEARRRAWHYLRSDEFTRNPRPLD
jgi:membrane protein YqaA with SNARE-associated domain